MMKSFFGIRSYLPQVSFDFGESIQLTSAATDSTDARLVWDDSGFAVSWLEGTGVANDILSYTYPPGNFATIASNMGAPQCFYEPCLVKTADGYAIAWSDNRYAAGEPEILFALLDSDATMAAGSEKRITNAPRPSSQPSLAWTGTGFGIAWSDRRAAGGQYDIYFALLDGQGNKTTGDVQITSMQANNDYAFAPSLVWTGTGFGVAWHDNRVFNDNIYFALINADGSKNGNDRLISLPVDNGWALSHANSELIWTGTEFALFYSGGVIFDSRIKLTRLDSNGNKIGEEIVISEDSGPSSTPKASFSGEYFGISWIDYRSGNPETYFTCCDSTGQKIGSDLRITDGAAKAYYCDIEWTGSGFAVIWSDYRSGNWDLYFSQQVLELGPGVPVP
jgi:hypothetical protein